MAATRMYWNDEMRKRAVFSKLTMSSWSGSIIGGMYLRGASSVPAGRTAMSED